MKALEETGPELVFKSLYHRGYGKEEGLWTFNEPLVMLGGRSQALGVSHILAVSEALWGEEMPSFSTNSSRTVKLEVMFHGKHIAINHYWKPGIGPGRSESAIYVDGLKQLGNPSRMYTFLDEMLPWRHVMRNWVNSLWVCWRGKREETTMSSSCYHERLADRLSCIMAKAESLPILLLAFPPFARPWNGRFVQIMQRRKKTTVVVFIEDINWVVTNLIREMQLGGVKDA